MTQLSSNIRSVRPVSTTGWADDRFMQAYDLIDGILSDHKTAEDALPEVRALLAEIEKADSLLAEVFTERAKGEQA